MLGGLALSRLFCGLWLFRRFWLLHLLHLLDFLGLLGLGLVPWLLNGLRLNFDRHVLLAVPFGIGNRFAPSTLGGLPVPKLILELEEVKKILGLDISAEFLKILTCFCCR